MVGRSVAAGRTRLTIDRADDISLWRTIRESIAGSHVLTQSFNGAGDTVTPTFINVLCLWMGEITIAYVLSRPVGLGPAGVFWAIASRSRCCPW